MNGITHFLVGIIIVLVVWHYFSNEWAEDKVWAKRVAFSIKDHSVNFVSILRVSIASIAAFFSHALVDGFAIFTYHPQQILYPSFDLITKAIMLPSAAIVAFIALKKDIRYAWGIIFSLAFDLWDSNTLDALMRINPSVDLRFLYAHQFEWTFGALFLYWAPVYYEEPLGFLVELVIIAILLIFYFFTAKKWPLRENEQIQPRFSLLIIVFLLFVAWCADGTLLSLLID